MEQLLLRVGEAAQVLGISRSQCYALTAGRVLPSIRLGNAIRIPKRDLEAWIEAKKEAALAGEREAASLVEVRHGQSRRPKGL